MGVHIKTNKVTFEGDYDNVIRTLVDLYLRKPLLESFVVERDGMRFFVSLEYESLPLFCSECNSIGYLISSCQQTTKQVDDDHDDDQTTTLDLERNVLAPMQTTEKRKKGQNCYTLGQHNDQVVDAQQDTPKDEKAPEVDYEKLQR